MSFYVWCKLLVSGGELTWHVSLEQNIPLKNSVYLFNVLLRLIFESRLITMLIFKIKYYINTILRILHYLIPISDDACVWFYKFLVYQFFYILIIKLFYKKKNISSIETILQTGISYNNKLVSLATWLLASQRLVTNDVTWNWRTGMRLVCILKA